MNKRFHLLFWLALAIPTCTLFYLVIRVALQLNVPTFSTRDAIGFLFLLMLGAGPIGTLYGAALYSTRYWFNVMAVSLALLISATHPFITLVGGGMAMIGAGICAWTLAFVGLAISGGIRLFGALRA
jgi:hypothetical protein